MGESYLTEQGVFTLLRKKLAKTSTYPFGFLQQNFLDDACVLPPDALGVSQILSTDTLVAGRHFDMAYCNAADVGWKAAAVSLSDIAACGGQPTGLLVALALPGSTSMAWLNDFYDGLLACLGTYNTPLLGGDTVAGETLTITTTVMGQTFPNHSAGRRFLAKPGDSLWLCGTHGLSAVGLQALQQAITGFEAAKEAHCRPKPFLEEGWRLAKVCKKQPFALTDTSDGLADALLNIAEASQVACVVEARAIPVPTEVSDWCDAYTAPVSLKESTLSSALATVLYGGEDFGLLAALPTGLTPDFHHWQQVGHVVTPSISPTDIQTGEVQLHLSQHEKNTVVRLSRAATYQHF